MNEIYKDSDRSLYIEHGFLKISGKNGVRQCMFPIAFHPVSSAAAAALKKAGKTGEWLMIATEGVKAVEIIIPAACRPAIQQANVEFLAKRANVCPAILERNAVRDLFAAAEAKREYPGEYFPLLQQAEAALSAWKAKYPEAADAERNAAMKAKAEELESKAADALLFDADGSIPVAEREKSAEEFRVKASELRAKAEGLPLFEVRTFKEFESYGDGSPICNSSASFDDFNEAAEHAWNHGGTIRRHDGKHWACGAWV